MGRRLWSLLARLVRFRQPVSLHNPTWRDRVDPEPYGRLDIADGLPRPARPVSDADDLARQLVAEHQGRHVGDYYPTPDALLSIDDGQGRRRANDEGSAS